MGILDMDNQLSCNHLVEKSIKQKKNERLKEGIPLDDQTILDLKIIAEKVGMKNVEEEIKSLLKLT